MSNTAQRRFPAGEGIEVDGVKYLIKECRTEGGTVYLTLQAPIEHIKVSLTFGGYQPTKCGQGDPLPPPRDE